MRTYANRQPLCRIHRLIWPRVACCLCARMPHACACGQLWFSLTFIHCYICAWCLRACIFVPFSVTYIQMIAKVDNKPASLHSIYLYFEYGTQKSIDQIFIMKMYKLIFFVQYIKNIFNNDINFKAHSIVCVECQPSRRVAIWLFPIFLSSLVLVVLIACFQPRFITFIQAFLKILIYCMLSMNDLRQHIVILCILSYIYIYTFILYFFFFWMRIWNACAETLMKDLLLINIIARRTIRICSVLLCQSLNCMNTCVPKLEYKANWIVYILDCRLHLYYKHHWHWLSKWL